MTTFFLNQRIKDEIALYSSLCWWLSLENHEHSATVCPVSNSALSQPIILRFPTKTSAVKNFNIFDLSHKRQYDMTELV